MVRVRHTTDSVMQVVHGGRQNCVRVIFKPVNIFKAVEQILSKSVNLLPFFPTLRQGRFRMKITTYVRTYTGKDRFLPCIINTAIIAFSCNFLPLREYLVYLQVASPEPPNPYMRAGKRSKHLQSPLLY
jgi:hypothetical protein